MEKSQTLPRVERNKKKVSPSVSLSSLKNTAVGKVESFSKLKKVNPLIRKKKTKKDAQNDQQEESTTEQVAADIPAETEDTGTAIENSNMPDDTRHNITESQSPVTESAAKLAPISSNDQKPPKSPHKPIKNIMKGTKGIVNIFKSKKEALPIMVDGPLPLDLRRSGNKVTEEMDVPEENMPEGTYRKIDDDQIEEDWSVSKTFDKVKKLSRTEVQESVYRDMEQEIIDDNDGIEKETTHKEINGDLASVTENHTNGTPIGVNSKSPSSLKKEILDITDQPRKSFDNPTIVRQMIRQRSVEAKYSTDKNELLFKILVIGELGTGKTSIIKRYVHQFFSQHYRATIGVDFALKVLSWDSSTIVRLQLWDIAGQERFGNMTRVYYKEAVGAFIVFDVTRVATFEAVTKWKQDLDAKVQLPDGEAIPCVLLANKCDQPKEGIVNNPNKMDEFCRENQFTAWFETSAKDNINIDEAAQSLVSKIVQNYQKKKQQEKETTNGTRILSVNGNKQSTEENNKFCNAC